jgi:hypothetical protein
LIASFIRSDLGGLTPGGGIAPAKASYLGHVRPILAHALPALASGGASLLGRELMGRLLFVGRPASFAGDLSLSGAFHRSKTAILCGGHGEPP